MSEASFVLLGGTGKTSRRLAGLLAAAGHSAVLLSRSGKIPEDIEASQGSLTGYKCDILDQSTYSDLFLEFPNLKAAYLVAPLTFESAQYLKLFIDFAREKGVTRFVLLSVSNIPQGGLGTGQTHAYLANLGVEWAVLRPTWFQENFIEEAKYRHGPGEQDDVISATGDGKLPWISCDDIAAMAYHCLTSETAPNTDYIVLGPELLSYDECTHIISDVLGRKYHHVKVTEEELCDNFVSRGVPLEYAKILALMDTAISKGSEATLNDVVEKVIGKKPKTFREFVEANKSKF